MTGSSMKPELKKWLGQRIAILSQLKDKEELSSVDWESVDKHIVQPTNTVTILQPDKAAWLLVVNLERAYYHAQFENAVLSSEAFAVLEAFMANLAAQASIEREDALGKLYDRLFEQSLIQRVFNRRRRRSRPRLPPRLPHHRHRHRHRHRHCYRRCFRAGLCRCRCRSGC